MSRNERTNGDSDDRDVHLGADFRTFAGRRPGRRPFGRTNNFSERRKPDRLSFFRCYRGVRFREWETHACKMKSEPNEEWSKENGTSANLTLTDVFGDSFDPVAARNESRHSRELSQDNWWALLALVLVVGTAAGNILVCLAIAWERRLQNVTNYFLMSLAVTDLMVAVLVMPVGILTLVKGRCGDESEERGRHGSSESSYAIRKGGRKLLPRLHLF